MPLACVDLYGPLTITLTFFILLDSSVVIESIPVSRLEPCQVLNSTQKLYPNEFDVRATLYQNHGFHEHVARYLHEAIVQAEVMTVPLR